jgi:thiol:disulfide interchange protein DsbC
MIRCQLLLAVTLLMTAIPAFSDGSRWYSGEQVIEGQQVYERKCAKCHGEDARGEKGWREVDSDGVYPAPPLDGSAYASQHTLDQLRNQIQMGGDSENSDMPSFKDRLSGRDIDSVIAYLQSKWTETTYQAWRSRQIVSAASRSQLDDPEQQNPAQQTPGDYWLKHHLSSASVEPGIPRKTPVRGITEVRVNNEFIYLSEDGRYAFTGHMIDLVDGTDLTETSQAMETRELIGTYPEDEFVVYPARGKELTKLTIFTDTSCGFCRKMHREVPELQANGVTVRFVPYPRRGLDSRGFRGLRSIWCAEDPVIALNRYIEDRLFPELDDPDKCTGNAVKSGYELGNRIGITGTPLLVFENGEKLKGYKSADKVLDKMNLTQNSL